MKRFDNIASLLETCPLPRLVMFLEGPAKMIQHSAFQGGYMELGSAGMMVAMMRCRMVMVVAVMTTMVMVVMRMMIMMMMMMKMIAPLFNCYLLNA